MADGVTFQSSTPATAPAGTEVATDDAGADGHVQFVKLAVPTNASATAWGDATDGLPVEVTNASSIGAVAPVSQAQNSSGLTTGATPYAQNDVLGAGWTFTSMGSSGRIVGATLLDKGDVTIAVDLFLSSGSITFGSDNAAASVSDSDAEKIHGAFGVSMSDLGANRVGTIHSVNIPYVCDATSLYVYARTADAHNQFNAATDLRLTLLYVVG